jgi:hypothetical protein
MNMGCDLHGLSFRLSALALLVFGDGFADALGDVGEGFVFFHDFFKKCDRSFKSKERILDFGAVLKGG